MDKESKSEIYFNDFIENLHNKPTISLRDRDYYLKNYSFLKNIIDIMPCALYLLDYQTRTYLYVSEEVKNLIGHTSNDFLTKGHEWLLRQLHPQDLDQFKGEVFEDFVTYVNSLSREQIKSARFSVNYRIKHTDGHYVQFLDQHIVIETDEENNPILILGICTDITVHKTDDKVIFTISEFDIENGNKLISSKSFPRSVKFTEREKEIILLLQKGNSSKLIANHLYISQHTVNTHRKNLLQKYNFKNTSELLSYAMANGIV